MSGGRRSRGKVARQEGVGGTLGGVWDHRRDTCLRGSISFMGKSLSSIHSCTIHSPVEGNATSKLQKDVYKSSAMDSGSNRGPDGQGGRSTQR